MDLEIKTGFPETAEAIVIGFFEDYEKPDLFSPEAVPGARKLIASVRNSGDFPGKESLVYSY